MTREDVRFVLCITPLAALGAVMLMGYALFF
jgi:hypothetical protein